MQKKLKRVQIDWWDHSSYIQNRWRTEGEIENRPCKCSTIGWILKENKLTITVVSTIAHEDDADCQETFKGDMTILKCAIQRIKYI